MTPEQKIKHLILNRIADFAGASVVEITAENVDALYDEADEDYRWDAGNEVRCSGIDTGLPAQSSRHYESRSVATKALDGSWVGWTYWYGGGKHSEPEAVDWMDEAYDLTCAEEEKLVTVRTFARVGA